VNANFLIQERDNLDAYNARIEAANSLIDFLRRQDPQAQNPLIVGLATLLLNDFPMHGLEALHAELSQAQAPTFERAAVRAVEYLGFSDGRVLRLRREALDKEPWARH
jgi:hypothetical protein